jgi:hypothetical protein
VLLAFNASDDGALLQWPQAREFHASRIHRRSNAHKRHTSSEADKGCALAVEGSQLGSRELFTLLPALFLHHTHRREEEKKKEERAIRRAKKISSTSLFSVLSSWLRREHAAAAPQTQKQSDYARRISESDQNGKERVHFHGRGSG